MSSEKVDVAKLWNVLSCRIQFVLSYHYRTIDLIDWFNILKQGQKFLQSALISGDFFPSGSRMLAVVCHKNKFKKVVPEHMVVEVGTPDMKMSKELQNKIGANGKPSHVTLATVLDILRKPVCSMEFVKPALEWAYPKLLKQVGLMDSRGNVVNLTRGKLRDSAFFHTAYNIETFRAISEHALSLSFPEIIELNRRFLARFYHADGSCALLPAQYVAIGLSKRFPYKIKDLVDLTVPFEKTDEDEEDEDYWKALASLKMKSDADPEKPHLINVIVQQHAEPKKEVAENDEMETREVDAKTPLKPLCTPSHSDMDEDTDSTLNGGAESEEFVIEAPIEEPQESQPLSNYERVREVASYIYVIFVSVASTLSLAGDYFMGTGGGYVPPPTPAITRGPVKRAMNIPEIMLEEPTSRCRSCGEFICGISLILFAFAYVALVTYSATEGLSYIPTVQH